MHVSNLYILGQSYVISANQQPILGGDMLHTKDK